MININANICEIDGAYYQVHLDWIPRVGDKIDLFSYMGILKHRGKKLLRIHRQVVNALY